MHSTNVMKYTEMICHGILMEEEEKDKIMISSNLHDIGKIGIDDSILKKDGKLTDEEYRKMKLHPVIGASIIGDINGFEEISTIIKYHHERYDGKGYPSGLKGEEIPLGSQIIAIADAFDAITTNRVYRKSLGYVTAIDILKYEKGKQFNSELVDIFIRELEKNHMQNHIDNVG
ncbi:Cyclic di-GMP phosphodiesterase response regulator RpfG [bioreactor metagenome]|uniref:Cyclic di-GMP phosphodiesterase response regulator RpfG n=1 Tax=bioreactor metagenome TaxID=1076179 RepID=A0A645FYU9_9ZZZZ